MGWPLHGAGDVHYEREMLWSQLRRSGLGWRKQIYSGAQGTFSNTDISRNMPHYMDPKTSMTNERCVGRSCGEPGSGGASARRRKTFYSGAQNTFSNTDNTPILYMEPETSITKERCFGRSWGDPGSGGASARRRKTFRSPATPSTILESSSSPCVCRVSHTRSVAFDSRASSRERICVTCFVESRGVSDEQG